LDTVIQPTVSQINLGKFNLCPISFIDFFVSFQVLCFPVPFGLARTVYRIFNFLETCG